MARESTDHPLTQLDAALQVSPSPEALARVRERVRQDQESPRVPSGWWWAAAATVFVAAGIASAVIFTSRRVPAAPSATAATDTSAWTDAGSPARVEAARARGPVGPGATSRRDRAASQNRVVPPAPAATHGPEVLVPPDERIALRNLLIALREGRATVPSAGLRVAEDDKGRMVGPAPIDIPSIKIEQLPGTPLIGLGGIVK
ncbi:MAG TPA: hypothetical protein VFV78_04455 [Vicinamibacterales bacterium]|nr:hypothetical protein [Vicinamibacterales bacterium]